MGQIEVKLCFVLSRANAFVNFDKKVSTIFQCHRKTRKRSSVFNGKA